MIYTINGEYFTTLKELKKYCNAQKLNYEDYRIHYNDFTGDQISQVLKCEYGKLQATICEFKRVYVWIEYNIVTTEAYLLQGDFL